ncbi:MAG: HAMP domain-containing histidine kinase [Crocinitomicaceae bacterium]|nr:HAMP domain-containing histidine kinase [Crocinitomicaceae bacterium]
MSRKVINAVVIFGALSLTSVLLIQVFWIKSTLKAQQTALTLQERQDSLNMRQFEEQVRVALRNVVEEINTQQADSSDLYGAVKQKSTNYFLVDINEDLHPYYLEQLLKRYFYDNGISQNFLYGIYDCFNDSIVYGNLIRFSRDSLYNPISDTIAGITSPELAWKKDGHYFTVFFPDVQNELVELSVQSSSPWLYLLIIVVLILGFFVFSLSVIIRQKRLAEVRNDFINNMTHELKTPISTIGLSSETILREDFSHNPEKLKKYASIIYKENKRLENQVEKVLNIAKLRENEITLNKSKIAIHEILEEAAESFRFNQLENGGLIETVYNATDDIINADEVHITNVVFNIIDNAVKYARETIVIRIQTKNERGGISILFEDNGIGIKKDDLKQIFEKFYRVPTGNLHDVKGFGLGLYYVKLIVEAHRGTIHVKSKVDEGTSFLIWLPK